MTESKQTNPVDAIRKESDYWIDRAAMCMENTPRTEREYKQRSKDLSEAADLLGECVEVLKAVQWKETPAGKMCAFCGEFKVNECHADCRLAAILRRCK